MDTGVLIWPLPIESVPDATTLLRFRHLLKKHALTQSNGSSRRSTLALACRSVHVRAHHRRCQGLPLSRTRPGRVTRRSPDLRGGGAGLSNPPVYPTYGFRRLLLLIFFFKIFSTYNTVNCYLMLSCFYTNTF